MQHETKFGPAGVERALPVAGDVLPGGGGGNDQECEEDQNVFQLIRPPWASEDFDHCDCKL